MTGLNTRSISRQNDNIDFLWSLSLDNTTGTCNVGFSGNRVFQFTFQNSKIYDTSGRFVGSYSPDNLFTVSGQVGQTSYDYWINDSLVALGNVYQTGYFDYFYINSNGTDTSFDGWVKGVKPTYSLATGGKHYEANNVITGTIVNNTPERQFRIFEASISQVSSQYEISGFTTGNITSTGYIYFTTDQIGLTDNVIPVSLKTNFGDIDFDYYITGDYTEIPNVYLNLSPDANIIESASLKTYDIIFNAFPSGTRLGISLEYLSGVTGKIYYYKTTGSPATSGFSRIVTGAATITATITGLVSGQDPQTLIYETGIGTGVVSSSLVYPTGTIDTTFAITGYGYASGIVLIDYEASGSYIAVVTGYVGINGQTLPVMGYNFLGTGESPGATTGIVPTGQGFLFVRPTGCLPISSGLVYGTDYISGSLAVDKAFAGPLTGYYSVLAVGYATGRLISGMVDSRFIRDFEQGYYVFTKLFSGAITGNAQDTGNFNPLSGCAVNMVATGFLTGYAILTGNLDCSSLEGFAYIPISGNPTGYYQGGGVVGATQVINCIPTGGFGSSETSANYLALGNTMTVTSRPGATVSGTGYFANVVGICSAADEQNFDQNKQWKEFFTGVEINTSPTDSALNQISSVRISYAPVYTDSVIIYSGVFPNGDTGYVTSGFGAIYTGLSGQYTGVNSSGVYYSYSPANVAISGSTQFQSSQFSSSLNSRERIDFFLSGEGIASIAITGSQGFQSYSIYKNGYPFYEHLADDWGGYARRQSTSGLEIQLGWTGSAPRVGTLLPNLSSGYYTIFSSYRGYGGEYPRVGFAVLADLYTPYFYCMETGGYVLVCIRGEQLYTSQRAWFKVRCIDGTAQSGVHYEPVTLNYSGYDNSGNYYGAFMDAAHPFYFVPIKIYSGMNSGEEKEFTLEIYDFSGCQAGNLDYSLSTTASVRIYNSGGYLGFPNLPPQSYRRLPVHYWDQRDVSPYSGYSSSIPIASSSVVCNGRTFTGSLLSGSGELFSGNILLSNSGIDGSGIPHNTGLAYIGNAQLLTNNLYVYISGSGKYDTVRFIGINDSDLNYPNTNLLSCSGIPVDISIQDIPAFESLGSAVRYRTELASYHSFLRQDFVCLWSGNGQINTGRARNIYTTGRSTATISGNLFLTGFAPYTGYYDRYAFFGNKGQTPLQNKTHFFIEVDTTGQQTGINYRFVEVPPVLQYNNFGDGAISGRTGAFQESQYGYVYYPIVFPDI